MKTSSYLTLAYIYVKFGALPCNERKKKNPPFKSLKDGYALYGLYCFPIVGKCLGVELIIETVLMPFFRNQFRVKEFIKVIAGDTVRNIQYAGNLHDIELVRIPL